MKHYSIICGCNLNFIRKLACIRLEMIVSHRTMQFIKVVCGCTYYLLVNFYNKLDACSIFPVTTSTLSSTRDSSFSTDDVTPRRMTRMSYSPEIPLYRDTPEITTTAMGLASAIFSTMTTTALNTPPQSTNQHHLTMLTTKLPRLARGRGRTTHYSPAKGDVDSKRCQPGFHFNLTSLQCQG